MAIIFDGRKFAQEKEIKLKAQFAKLAKMGKRPQLVFILLGKNKEAEFYVSLKEKIAMRLGVDFTIKRFSIQTDFPTLNRYIATINQDKNVFGITFEYPLPEKFKKILPTLIAPPKDIDCLTPTNLGRLLLGDWFILPSSVKATLEILNFALSGKTTDTKNTLKGKQVTLVGFGNLVGRPLSIALKQSGATLTICGSSTKNLANFTRSAEILISATGKMGLIKKEMVKKGAIVVDLGYPKADAADKVKEMAGFLTPVPGGVGPVSIVCLFENLLEAINLIKS